MSTPDTEIKENETFAGKQAGKEKLRHNGMAW